MAIYKCEWCQQDYCGDCTSAEEWQRYCSIKCESEVEIEEKKVEKVLTNSKKRSSIL
jgi:hypothetical protein